HGRGLELRVVEITAHRAVGDVPGLDDPLHAARAGGQPLAGGAECRRVGGVLGAFFEVLDLPRLEFANEVAGGHLPALPAPVGAGEASFQTLTALSALAV